MDIRQLLYFTTIAEEGSISAAAKKLHLSQPPLSYQMKLLEEELHLPLIERSARGIALTEAGRVLYKRAQGILELSELTRKEMLAMASGFTGTLHIGTVSSSGASLLGWRIPAFHQKYPQIGFAIHEGNTFELMEMLESGLIELAIVRTPFHNDQLNCLYLSPEPMIAAGAASFFPAGMPSGQPISLELLGHAPVILYRRFEKILLSLCEQKGDYPAGLLHCRRCPHHPDVGRGRAWSCGSPAVRLPHHAASQHGVRRTVRRGPAHPHRCRLQKRMQFKLGCPAVSGNLCTASAIGSNRNLNKEEYDVSLSHFSDPRP